MNLFFNRALPLLLLATPAAHAAHADAAQDTVWEPVGPSATLGGDGRVLSAQDAAQVLVFDSATGADNTVSTTASPRTIMGLPFDLGAGGGADPTISQIVFYIAYTGAAPQTYNELRVQFQLYDVWVSGRDPVFSSPVGPVTFGDVTDPVTFNPHTYARMAVNMSWPVSFNGLTAHGIAINIQGDTGSGLVSTDDLTTLVRYGATPVAVGANDLSAAFGYRNVGGQTTLNFSPSDASTFGDSNESLVMQIYAINADYVFADGFE